MKASQTPLFLYRQLLMALQDHRDECCQQIAFCKTSWDKLYSNMCTALLTLEDRAKKKPSSELPRFGLGDETMWTFLVAVGYAAGSAQGVQKLSRLLTGQELPGPESPRIWLEALPFPPRKREGSTHLDLI